MVCLSPSIALVRWFNMLHITNEARALQGPWTSLVKGRGIGSVTRKYNVEEAKTIRSIADLVDKKLKTNNAYSVFSHKLVNFVLDFNNPNCLFFQRKDLYPRIDSIVESLKSIESPYYYISASSVMFECFGKLGLDPQILLTRKYDLVSDALKQLENLPNTTVKDRYIAVQAYGNLFLGVAHVGFTHKINENSVDHIEQALNIIYSLDDVWHRGRGSAAFLTVLGIIGFHSYIDNDKNSHIKNLICFLYDSLKDTNRVESSTNEYVFSILLMINTLSTFDGQQYLEYKQDWLSVIDNLMEKISPDLKLIFTHYYLSALDNLNILEKHIPNVIGYIEDNINLLTESKSGEIDYMGYTYFIDLAFRLGKTELVTDDVYDELIKNICHNYNFSKGKSPKNMLYASGLMRISYALYALSYENKINLLFKHHDTFKDAHLLEGIIQNHIDNWPEDHESIYLLNHSLLDMALSQRAANANQSFIDKNFNFSSSIQNKKTLNIKDFANTKRHPISIHPFFTGMNSRRFYVNLDKGLYNDGNHEVRRIFDCASEILGYSLSKDSSINNVLPFFMEQMHFPKEVDKLWNYIGSSMTTYNLALFEQLKSSSNSLVISSVGGESYGMIAAAITAGSLTLEDGLNVANNILGIIYNFIHSKDFGLWHIVSLTSSSIEDDVKKIQEKFDGHIDIFRWQSINTKNNEVHVYVNSSVFSCVKKYVEDNFADVEFSEFKRPTNEIIHSSKLSLARVIINNYLIESNIKFYKPKIPIISNNGSGIVLTAEGVRSLLLDMANIPMYTAQAFDSIKMLDGDFIDAIVEIGYGNKTLPFIKQHNIKNEFFEYYGDKDRLESVVDNILKSKKITVSNNVLQSA